MEAIDLQQAFNAVPEPLIGGAGVALGFFLKYLFDRIIKSEAIAPELMLLKWYEMGQLGSTGRKRLENSLRSEIDSLAEKMTPSGDHHVAASHIPDPCPNIVVHRTPSAVNTFFHCIADRHSERRSGTILYVRLAEPPYGIDETKTLSELGLRTEEHIKNKATVREQAFLSLLSSDNDLRADLWIDATRYTWPSAQLVEDGYRDLAEYIKAAYPALNPIMEINAASDVAADMDLNYWNADALPPNGRTSQKLTQPSYVSARNAVFNQVKSGFVFPDFFEDRRRKDHREELDLPIKLLNQRTQSLREELPPKWTCLTIRGAAGSGKTQTAHWFLHQLSRDKNAKKGAIVAELSTRDLLSTHPSDDGELHLDVLGILKRVLEHRLTELSSERSNPVVRRACADLADKLLRESSRPTIFVADDLDNFQKLRVWTSKAVDLVHTNPADIRIVRIFRSSGDGDRTADGEHVLRLPLFTSSEGRTVLFENAGVTIGTDAETVNRLVARTPFASSEGVSLYGLRLIKEWLQGSEQERPRDVLQRIIARIIGPISTKMGQAISYDEMKSSLERVRELLDKSAVQVSEFRDAIPDMGHMELTDLLGDLAWFSKYHEQEPLTPGSVKRWSSGSIDDEQLAEALLLEGAKAGIFSLHDNDTRWADQLVADGCAVMRLRNTANDGLVAEMAAKLVANNASEMLWMASDYDTFLRIINAVADREQPLLILDTILSGASIAWLARDRRALQGICHRLLELGRSLQTIEERARLSQSVWRLAQQDPDFLNALNDLAPADETARCVVARTIPAEQFQATFADLGAGALEVAAWIWPAEDGQRLAQWCSETRSDPAQISSAVASWCERQADRVLVDFLSQLVQRDEAPKSPHGATVFGTAARVLSKRPLPQEIDRENAIAVVKSALRTLSEDDNSDTTLALFNLLGLDQEFTASDRRWVADPSRSFLVPTSPLGPSSLARIRDQISKGGVWIAKTSDLAWCDKLTFMGREFAGDDLKRDFVQRTATRRADPSELRIWDGKRTEIRNAPRNFPLRWRAKVDIRDRSR